MHNDEFHDLLFGWSEEGGSGGSEICPYRKIRTERHAGIKLENLRKGGPLEDLDFNERVTIQWIRWH